jgi:hypothetical protein
MIEKLLEGSYVAPMNSVLALEKATRLRYSSGKRGLTSFRKYQPSESVTFSKNE